MRSRVINPDAHLVQEFVYTQQQLPTHKPVVQYIRQSTTKQLKRNKQSYELQDSDLRRRLVQGYGWKDTDEFIFKVDIDQGKSGTKRRDERTGLDQVWSLVEGDKVGAIAAFDVSRLYRVLSRAEYGAFCDMVLERKIPVITYQRIYWPNRVDNDQLNDDFKASAMFIEEVIKGKLIAAKNRHIEYDFSYGGHSVPFGYIVAGMGEEGADRKHYVEYKPHADKIRWLFRRFREVCGNLPLLAQELVSTDFRFPPFEQGIASRVSLPADSDGSFPLRNRQAIIGILTNRAYIGWYEYGGMRVSKEAHTPIVELADFLYAWERLSSTTLDGEEQERKPRERRCGGALALLDGILTNGENAVYTIESKYTARSEVHGFPQTELVVNVAELDNAFSTALLNILATLDAEQTRGIHEQLAASQHEHNEQATKLGKALARIDSEIANEEMSQHISKEEGDEQGYRQATKQLVQLRKDRAAIEAKREQASGEASELTECLSLIDQALTDWCGMKIGKQKRLVKLLVAYADIAELSPHFLRLDVQLSLPTGQAFTLYLYRAHGSRQFWNDEEDGTLAALFASASKQALMEALPSHSWTSICYRGHEKLGIRRAASGKDVLCQADMGVVEQYGASADHPVWYECDTAFCGRRPERAHSRSAIP